MICKYCKTDVTSKDGIHICCSPEEYRKQIAELQEELLTLNLNHKSIKNSNQKLIMDNANMKEKLNEQVEITLAWKAKSERAEKEVRLQEDKLHRRNLQIKDLQKKLANRESLLRDIDHMVVDGVGSDITSTRIHTKLDQWANGN